MRPAASGLLVGEFRRRKALRNRSPDRAHALICRRASIATARTSEAAGQRLGHIVDAVGAARAAAHAPGTAPSSRRPRGRGGRWPHRHTPSRSADGGMNCRRSRRASAGRAARARSRTGARASCARARPVAAALRGLVAQVGASRIEALVHRRKDVGFAIRAQASVDFGTARAASRRSRHRGRTLTGRAKRSAGRRRLSAVCPELVAGVCRTSRLEDFEISGSWFNSFDANEPPLAKGLKRVNCGFE